MMGVRHLLPSTPLTKVFECCNFANELRRQAAPQQRASSLHSVCTVIAQSIRQNVQHSKNNNDETEKLFEIITDGRHYNEWRPDVYGLNDGH